MPDLCKACNVVHGDRNRWGEITPCYCLPKGKTCKDCKFEANCLIEQVIEGPEIICRNAERGFAEEGQLSYQERCNINFERDIAQQKEEKTAMTAVQGFIFSNHVVLIDAYRQSRFIKRDLEEVMRAANVRLQRLDKAILKKVLLQLYHEPLLGTTEREQAAQLLKLSLFDGVEVSKDHESAQSDRRIPSCTQAVI